MGAAASGPTRIWVASFRRERTRWSNTTAECQPRRPACPMPTCRLAKRLALPWSGQAADLDKRVTETKYNWTLRKPPTRSLIPPGSTCRRTSSTTQLPGCQPNGACQLNRTAATLVRPRPSTTPPAIDPTDAGCGNKPAWANLPCKVYAGSAAGHLGPARTPDPQVCLLLGPW